MRTFWKMKNIALALLLAVACFAQKRAITHEDVWLMKRTGEPVVSPDGRSVVFSVIEPDYDSAKQSSDLWLAPADGYEAAKQLTFTKAAESGPVWSPDGRRLAFVTRREGDDAPQVYVLTMDGGEAQRITRVPGGASNPQWRPDGKAILFESAYDPLAIERKLRKWNARIYDAMPIRFWNAWLDEKKPHIFVQELGGSTKSLDVLMGSKLAESPGFAGLFNPAGGQSLQAIWTPDGQSIVFAAYVNRTEMMSAETEARLFVASASGGEPRALTSAGLQFSRPKFSPAGDRLYALTERKAKAGGRLYSLKRLAQFTWPAASQPVVLTEAWDRSVSAYSIARDGKTVYLDAEDNGADQLFQIAAQGGAVKRLFPVEHGGYANVQPVSGGLIAVFQTAAQPPEIVRLDVGKGSHAMLTNFNADRLRELDTADALQFWFTAKNGKKIHNLLYLPPQFDRNKRYPLVVFPHGGPAAMSKDAFTMRWNAYLLTSPGYVLLETNYTGSTGFGEKFADDIERDVLRGPAEEILEAIEQASRQYPFIDKSRQAAAGASYGGYLMNWFNGHTRQFKCLVIHSGAINNESQYGTNDGGIDRELRMGVPIWEKGGQWSDQSPIRYSGSFQTPSLITVGEQDFRVPLSESITTFKILQRRGVPSRLIVFPEEGHWILKGENSRLHMQEALGWLKRYL